MYSPLVMYELAKLRIADDVRYAEQERLARIARDTNPAGQIDAVRFRDRLTRLFGVRWSSAQQGSSSTAA